MKTAPITTRHPYMTRLMALGLLLTVSAHAESPATFDHAQWTALLQQHVHWTHQGHASQVNYRSMAQDKVRLQRYLASLSAVSHDTFDRWSRDVQLAFLLNAYNAFTVQLILGRYPDMASIKDLGSFLQSPWKKSFIPLLGATRSLDDIEQGMIRGSPHYRDPRIHFAINCASIGCPALRPEAYLPEQLDKQLEDQAQRFLGDKTRNYLQGSTLYLSPIFKWYREDFEQNFRGNKNLPAFLATYAHALGLSVAQLQRLRSGKLSIAFSDYDWRLNDGRQ